jgi:phosphatidylglycerophosphatase A
MPVLFLATAGGVGLSPWAPGTLGALVGVLLFFAFSHLGPALYGLTLAALTCLGIWVSDVAEGIFQRSDDGRIVIDEVAGQLLTLLPVVALRGSSGAGGGSPEIAENTWWALVVTAFVLFRVLDIWKPGPVGWAERRFAGGVGVMADDIVAGGLGAAALTVAVALVAGGCSA